MADFYGMVKNELNHSDDNKILTENGAVAYASAGDSLVDFSYAANSLRNKTPNEVAALFEQCYTDNPMLATKMMFQMGDVREGKGERRTFNICLRYMALAHPEIAKELLPLVPEYTRWDHVAEMATCGNRDVEKFARAFMAAQLRKDYEIAKKMEANPDAPQKELSLAAKWAPSLGAKKDGYHKIALKLVHELGVSNKEYRQMLSTIRGHLNIIERSLSQKKEITAEDMSKMTSAQQLRLQNAMERNAGEEYQEYIEKVKSGEMKMNAGVSTPADVVHRYYDSSRSLWHGVNIKGYNETLELAWKNLAKLENADGASVIVVRDDSGSMTSVCSEETKMTCLEVATAFSVYCAEQLTGPFKDKFISFSEHPKFLDMSGLDSLHDKLVYCAKHSEVANTNIEATFDLLLNTAVKNHLTQAEIPGCVLIFSDMEFDSMTCTNMDDYTAPNAALFEELRHKWEKAGYEMPVCAFWNLNVHRAVVPSVDERGVVLLSGYTTDNLDMLMSGELAKFTPAHQLELALSNPRYDAVEKAFLRGREAERAAGDNTTRVSFNEYMPEKGYTRVSDLKAADEQDFDDELSEDYFEEDEEDR